jgi:hypothetical protein
MECNQDARNRWTFQPFKGSPLKIGSVDAPCWFHRWTQRLALGIVWTPMPKAGAARKRRVGP